MPVPPLRPVSVAASETELRQLYRIDVAAIIQSSVTPLGRGKVYRVKGLEAPTSGNRVAHQVCCELSDVGMVFDRYGGSGIRPEIADESLRFRVQGLILLLGSAERYFNMGQGRRVYLEWSVVAGAIFQNLLK